ncbi:hypothetical protein CU669_13410 [Paramagnetospirillum kuznetsovii]|uniref:Anti-sigma factor n=1 Tax=Paramagnetospirillum kuznetsovii TaxID=2053833 RepID=A0A364NWE7_9PROT|nr:anti-sigma factor [Paramagnetospirillum kuznetsovii]RAU21419.1 hypothetical protein CU669_13410 [Paramagnetospirillum kuznetsovii]
MNGRVSEDDLHAYLDGQLEPERVAAVEAWLASDPIDAERVRQWAEQKDGLHRLFDRVLDEPVPPRLTIAAITARRRWAGRSLPRLAAALALVMLGAVGGWWLRDEQGLAGTGGAVAMVGDALSAHVVFASEVRHPVEVAVSERAHLVGWLSKRLGAELKVPDLSPSGYALIGGRLLPASTGPAAQFMYESKTGLRLTLYLRRGDGGATAFRFANQNGVEAFYWMDGPFGYAIVADLPRDQLMPLAKAVYLQLEK